MKTALRTPFHLRRAVPKAFHPELSGQQNGDAVKPPEQGKPGLGEQQAGERGLDPPRNSSPESRFRGVLAPESVGRAPAQDSRASPVAESNRSVESCVTALGSGART